MLIRGTPQVHIPQVNTIPRLRVDAIPPSMLHDFVSKRLEYLIRSGYLKPGDQLPSERELLAAFGARGTCVVAHKGTDSH
jgi:hypothetical protein